MRDDRSMLSAPVSRTMPVEPEEMLRLATSYLSSSRMQEAEALIDRVLGINPREARALHLRGLIAARTGRAEEAVALLRKAIALRHSLLAARLDLVRILAAAGRLEEAVKVGEAAVRLAPQSAVAHMVLGEVLDKSGTAEAAIAAHREAVRLDHDSAEPHFQLGLAYQSAGNMEAAAASFAEAVEHAPARGDFHYCLGTALHSLRRLDEASEAYERALSLKPGLADTLFEIGKPRHIHALLERRDLRGALRSIDSYLIQRPGQSCALALKTIVLDELGQRDQSRALADFDGLIRQVHLEDTVGPTQLAELNRELGAHIRSHPTLRPAPAAFSIHRGKTTGELLAPPFGPTRIFEKLVNSAVSDYAANLYVESDHPFIANRPSEWNLTMWANVLDSEGFQVPHIHPSGWLSAVYYVQVPEVVNSDGQAGWIEFGEPYKDIAHSVQPELRAIRPQPGLLLLFPSYFYHRTLPFLSSEQRVSIAFDVVPRRSRAIL